MLMQALKMAAIRGSLESLEQLTNPVDGNLAPPGELLPIFYHHLDPKKIPHPDRPAPNTMHFLELAIAALKGITSCLNQHDGSRNKVLLPDIESRWTPKIWKWTHFLLVHCFAEPMLPTMDTRFQFGVYVATMNLLTALVHQSPELRTTVASTPGVIALTTKLWIAETKMGNEILSFRASRVLERFVSVPGPGWRDQIVASGSGPFAIAKTILDRIRVNSMEPSIKATSYISLHSDLLIAMGFTDGPTTDVCRALWSQHSIAVVTKAIFCLSSDKPADMSSIPDSVIGQCLTFGVIYLDISFTNSEDTHTWIVQAVEARLIPALLKATRFFSYEGALEPICSNFLGDVIPQYLVYRSVLRSVARSLKNIRRHGLEKKLAETGPFRDSWNTLNDLVSERLAIKAHYDKDPQHALCENPKVSAHQWMYWILLNAFGSAQKLTNSTSSCVALDVSSHNLVEFLFDTRFV
jgi:hypothetical protein